ncbi:enoyl-CoA hydratase/isomerase family protein [Azospirillum sp. B510]|uniref:enoyl-CoA hydratase/isomerase family protein n=1 Tax=Azospirillum sp. (strain B510) TaxID=137722 RepID=UPI0005A7608C|nr:enoyl-CoA hydratase-related protein [Azospirillum sp. B510]
MQQDIVRLERQGAVAVLTLDHPERRNALSQAMRETLLVRLRALGDPQECCRAIVLTGSGGHFCAGGDLSEMEPRSALEIRHRMSLLGDIVRVLVSGPRPVVAAVEGHAAGAGLALASATDFVVAAEDARFSTAFVKVAVVPDTGILWSLAQKVGAGRARELLLQAGQIDARCAFELGLVGKMVAPGAAKAAAVEVAQALARFPPAAVALLKAALAGGCDTLEQTFETEINLQPVLRASSDHLEAVKAFLEKRKPAFTGR